MSAVIDPNRNTVITIVRSIDDSEATEEIASMRVTSLLIEISKGREGDFIRPGLRLPFGHHFRPFHGITMLIVIKCHCAFYTLHETNEFCLKWYSGKPLRLLPSEKTARK